MAVEIKYFIPVANEFYATGVGHYVIAATVIEDKDPVYKNIELFQRLLIVGPKEISDEWHTLPRQYFTEVHGITEGKISLEKFMELSDKYGKAYIKEEIDTEKMQETIDKCIVEEEEIAKEKVQEQEVKCEVEKEEDNKKTFYRAYCDEEIEADEVGSYIEEWKNRGSKGELYHYLGMNCHQYNIWVRHGVLIKEEHKGN